MRYEMNSPTFRPGEPSIAVRMIVIPDDRVAFSKGGLAQHAKAVAQAGRYGDDLIVHMNHDEFELLKQMWGEPTYHPVTGMPEYFSLKSLIPIIGAVLMMTGVGSGLGATLLGSGASAAASGALGNAIIGGITSAASGGNGGDVLRGAALGGLGGYFGGKFGGAGAAGAKAARGGQELNEITHLSSSPSWTNGLDTLSGVGQGGPSASFGSRLGTTSKLAADTPAMTSDAASIGTDTVGSMNFGDYAKMDSGLTSAATAAGATGALQAANAAPAAAGASKAGGFLSQLMGGGSKAAAGATTAGSTNGLTGLLQSGMAYAKQHPYISAMLASQLFTPDQEQPQGGAQAQPTDPNFLMHLPQLQFNRSLNPNRVPASYTYGEKGNNQPYYLDNSLAAMTPQAPAGFASGGEVSVNDWLSDWPTTAQFLNDRGYVYTRAGIRSLKQDQNGGTLVPDTLTFDSTGKAIPSLQAANMVTIPQSTFSADSQGTSSAAPISNQYAAPETQGYNIPPLGSIFKSAYGRYRLPNQQTEVVPSRGLPMFPSREQSLARGGSAVVGAGTGRTDEIPARLSDGEYVMDAETVAMLGDGSTKAGAARLDQMRANLRKHKGKALAQGKLSPNARAPEQYMKGNK